ncbi:phosphoenolpyruvate synthase [archaeon]|nr:phosphoenolpyruvate synthase [archaeon]|tara:strand:+ start:2228 stop:4627 length:2400 start_codon:yes stop_codon:yes gene_type:complete
MANIKWFSEISNKDVPIVGGKGASLGEMYNAEFPIPPGFCVTANAYKRFVQENNLTKPIKELLKDLDVNDSATLQKTAKEIQNLIKEAQLPEQLQTDILEAYEDLNVNNNVFKDLKGTALDILHIKQSKPYVAVRSSATAEDLPDASFAGQQKTFLNIKGNDRLLVAVSGCFASLFTARAIYYRVKKGFDHMQVALSVVVQKQIQSEVSGVMFTVNPSNNDENEIVVEAGFGLGEVVVAGAITPDHYIIDKSKEEIITKDVREQSWKLSLDETLLKTMKRNLTPDTAKQQKLPDSKILELAEIGKKLEEHYKKPQDIEFALENHRMYIVQSRPITTLKKEEASTSEENKHEEKPNEVESMVGESQEQLLKGLAASPGVVSGPVRILADATEIDKVKKGDVLVTKMTNPDYVPAMERAIAIVTDEGGLTSHAAIISRELGIPAVVGTLEATKKLKEDQIITIDGQNGLVFDGKAQTASKPVEETQEHTHEEHAQVLTATKVYMNLGEPDKIPEYKHLDFDGIGLMRIEFIVTSDVKVHPKLLLKNNEGEKYTNKLAEGIGQVAKAISPRPLIVRFSDFKSNEYKNLEGGAEFEHDESNPMLGWRGVSRYINDEFKDVFKLECAAIKKVREEGSENVHVMLPFVRNVPEVKTCLGIMESVGLNRSSNFKIYLMAEVPSMAFIPEKFAQLPIDGISIGSNDLTQMVLGVDRDSALLGRAGYFDERNEAVLAAILSLLKGFKAAGKTVSICGQAPSQYPEIVEFLVKNGIDAISVNPDVVDKVREQIAVIERKILLDEARDKK